MDPLVLRVAARFLGAKDFSSPEALREYLKEHPKADKSKHKVKKPEDDETTTRMKEHEKANPGSINWKYDPKKTKSEPVKDETDEEAAARRKKYNL